jgi:hypothetical protein
MQYYDTNKTAWVLQEKKITRNVNELMIEVPCCYPLGEPKLCLGGVFIYRFASKLEKFLARNSNPNGSG